MKPYFDLGKHYFMNTFKDSGRLQLTVQKAKKKRSLKKIIIIHTSWSLDKILLEYVEQIQKIKNETKIKRTEA